MLVFKLKINFFILVVMNYKVNNSHLSNKHVLVLTVFGV